MARVIRAERTGPAWLPGEVVDAKTEAAAIRARAHHDAEAVRVRAHAEGYEAGRAEAAKQLFDLTQMQAELAKRTETQALQAVLLVAAELLGSTLQAEPQKILDVLAPQLARVRHAQRLSLRLHPDDAAWLDEHRAALQARCAALQLDAQLELLADPSVTRGGCMVEANVGELDARVETRLTLLAKALGIDDCDADAEAKERR
jgi:flagellar biosynthesis/type III secretory pathway protein FliH